MIPDTPTKPRRHVVEATLEHVVFGSRWLQVPLYIGLIFMLAVTVVKFGFTMFEMTHFVLSSKEGDFILIVLSLVDLVLVANLVVMVIISGYENFISRIEVDEASERLAWFGKLDAGSLKIKLASSIVAISSIHLLKRFLEAETVDNAKLYALMALHLTFVVSALLLAVIDRVGYAKNAGKGH